MAFDFHKNRCGDMTYFIMPLLFIQQYVTIFTFEAFNQMSDRAKRKVTVIES